MANHIGSALALVAVMALLFSLTTQQLVFPLQQRRIVPPQQDNSQRHQLSRQHNNKDIHKFEHRSKLSHNIEYIRKHFGKSPSQESKKINSSQHHNLNKQTGSMSQDHLRIQTFNLEPNSYAFSLPMKIGGFKYQMSIDSGSSDIFIKGEKSKGKPKLRYQCGQTCINTHQQYSIGYLDGKLKTYESKLQVQIGEHKFNESILVAYEVEHNFHENQGLVGLSFPALATNPNPSFLQTLKNQKIIDVYAFGVNLNFQDENRSFITFGSYDNKFFQGKLDIMPLTSKLFYYVDSQGVSIGSGPLLKIKTALFDTGNTCISIPIKYQSEILKQFNKGQGQGRNQCFFYVQHHAQMFSVLRCRVGNFSSMPTLNIHMDSKVYTIQKQFYTQACDRRPSEMNSLHSHSNQGVWYCDLYIESVSGMSQLFLGDSFFNRYYTYFNLQGKQVGVARNKEVIKLQKVIQNQLDADQEDWQQILVRLNKDQTKQDIALEIKTYLNDQYQDQQDDQYYKQQPQQSLFDQFIKLIGF